MEGLEITRKVLTLDILSLDRPLELRNSYTRNPNSKQHITKEDFNTHFLSQTESQTNTARTK